MMGNQSTRSRVSEGKYGTLSVVAVIPEVSMVDVGPYSNYLASPLVSVLGALLSSAKEMVLTPTRNITAMAANISCFICPTLLRMMVNAGRSSPQAAYPNQITFRCQ